MSVPFPSALIRYERLRRNWSLEGLCQGVCAVSYGSKIEQGKAEPGQDILRALMERLDIRWYDGEDAEDARRWCENMQEAVLSIDHERQQMLTEALEANRERWVNGPHMLDVLLLSALRGYDIPAEETGLAAFESCFDERQRALWLMGQCRYEEAAGLMPCAYAWLGSGTDAYRHGRYAQAIERLLRACSMAADEGQARVLLHARMVLGNCYSVLPDYDAMMRHYASAMRLARDLGEKDLLESARYNIAATELQMGRYEQAYAYFSTREEHTAMSLHKLAVCLEKLGRMQEALETIRQAMDMPVAYPPPPISRMMMELVRFRLTNPDYLRRSEYGEMLLDCFKVLREEIADSYAAFHLPWVEEWYVANRQYKQAYELKKAFS